MATVKKSAAKKPAAKKTTVKKQAVSKPIATAPVVAAEKCACGDKCACGKECACGTKCACGCCGGGFWRFVKKLIIVLIIFALGFAAAKMCCGNKPNMRGPRPVFVDGCLDASSVKCPQMLEKLPTLDVDGDGCITRSEFRAGKRAMRH